jgi:hypothetical protein
MIEGRAHSEENLKFKMRLGSSHLKIFLGLEITYSLLFFVLRK